MLTGGCQCGEVRYASPAEPASPTICTCIDCRRATGAPVAAWFTVPRATLRWQGATPRTHASSPGVLRGFCPNCGTPLTWQRGALPGEIDILTATLDDPDLAPPRDHVWTRDRIPWMRWSDGLPEHTRGRNEG